MKEREREREKEKERKGKRGRKEEKEKEKNLEWKSEHCHQLSVCYSLQLCTIAVFLHSAWFSSPVVPRKFWAHA